MCNFEEGSDVSILMDFCIDNGMILSCHNDLFTNTTDVVMKHRKKNKTYRLNVSNNLTDLPFVNVKTNVGLQEMTVKKENYLSFLDMLMNNIEKDICSWKG